MHFISDSLFPNMSHFTASFTDFKLTITNPNDHSFLILITNQTLEHYKNLAKHQYLVVFYLQNIIAQIICQNQLPITKA